MGVIHLCNNHKKGYTFNACASALLLNSNCLNDLYTPIN